MDKNKKIAELLLPNLKNDRNYYDMLYEKRDLPSDAEVTRYGPSPTGFMHIGNFLSALIDSRVAKSTNGVFFVRIEDTDQKREIDGSKQTIFETLDKMGIHIDEGNIGENFSDIGGYGPYTQSKRKHIYLAYAKWLIEKGRVYPCFCSSENLEEIREGQRKKKIPTGYYGEHAVCRELSFEEIKKRIDEGQEYVLRLKSTGSFKDNERIDFKDEIRGQRTFPKNFIDAILIKANKLPVYSFAHAVDDHLMGTTVVIRGEDWLPSLAEHLEIFQSLEFDYLKYAHTPLIQKLDNANKRKISKRKDPESDMRYYFEKGYLTDAVIEYLLTIANSNFEEWREKNQDKDLDEFNFKISKLGSNSPLLDMNKLNNISKNIVSGLSPEEVLDETIIWAEQYNPEYAKVLKKDKAYSLKVFSIEKNNEKKRKDIYKWDMVEDFYSYMFERPTHDDLEIIKQKGNIKDIINILNEYKHVYDMKDDKLDWFDKIKTLGHKFNYAKEVREWKKNKDMYKGHCGDISTIIRIAITGRTQTPDLYEVLMILGKPEILSRIDEIVLKLKQNT